MKIHLIMTNSAESTQIRGKDQRKTMVLVNILAIVVTNKTITAPQRMLGTKPSSKHNINSLNDLGVV